MHGAQVALGFSDGRAEVGQKLWGDASILESPIKRSLRIDQFLAHSDRLCLHRIEEFLDSTQLLGIEVELVGKLQGVHGARATV
jgi:hypothetical protein